MFIQKILHPNKWTIRIFIIIYVLPLILSFFPVPVLSTIFGFTYWLMQPALNLNAMIDNLINMPSQVEFLLGEVLMAIWAYLLSAIFGHIVEFVTNR